MGGECYTTWLKWKQRCRCLATDHKRNLCVLGPLTCPKRNFGRGCSPPSCPGRKSSSQCQCPLTSWRAYLESHKCGETKGWIPILSAPPCPDSTWYCTQSSLINLHVKVPLPLIPANGFSWKRTCNPIFAASLFMTLASFSPYGAGRPIKAKDRAASALWKSLVMKF